jgi:uncharacterized protein (TIGR02145 family)
MKTTTKLLALAAIALLLPLAVQAQAEKVAMLKQSSDSIKTSSSEDGVTINGITWAKKNVGALNNEDYGNYFTFQEAQSACPNGWRLPRNAEFVKLNKSRSVWTTLNGVNGRRFGDANNYVFLPAAGNRSIKANRALINQGSVGYYWSGSQVSGGYGYCLVFTDSNSIPDDSSDKDYGFTVRCVKE